MAAIYVEMIQQFMKKQALYLLRLKMIPSLGKFHFHCSSALSLTITFSSVVHGQVLSYLNVLGINLNSNVFYRFLINISSKDVVYQFPTISFWLGISGYLFSTFRNSHGKEHSQDLLQYMFSFLIN